MRLSLSVTLKSIGRMANQEPKFNFHREEKQMPKLHGKNVCQMHFRCKEGHDDCQECYYNDQQPVCPKIVVLCGSTRFYETFQQANFEETMKGNIVLSVGFYPHADVNKNLHGEDVGCTPEQKINLDEL